jgi:beta-ribofuranosylaminobenzene 5'-phosphate synthase
VTGLFEMAAGHPVTITTPVQDVVGADTEQDDEVNYRVVELKDGVTAEVLIYAVSCTPLRRLKPEFRQDLMRADIPIGRILRRHRIESRRAITDARVVRAGTDLARMFNVHRCEPMLSRKYRITHREEPLIAIEEIFPCTAFTDEIRVLVDAPSRIHITLLDMNGASGRVDGGVGVTLDEPGCVLDARKATGIEVRGGDEESRRRVADATRAAREVLGDGGGRCCSRGRGTPGRACERSDELECSFAASRLSHEAVLLSPAGSSREAAKDAKIGYPRGTLRRGFAAFA